LKARTLIALVGAALVGVAAAIAAYDTIHVSQLHKGLAAHGDEDTGLTP
jgi:hypothetical protein